MSIAEPLLDKLKDRTLLRPAGLIGGRWMDAIASGARFDVENPSTGAVIASLPDMGAVETREAIDACAVAQSEWAARAGKARSTVLRRWYDLVVANTDDLATILTMEVGKPLPEAIAEIAYGASFIEWFAEEAKRIYGDTIPGHQDDKRIIVIKQPVGVVAAITPWNFPCAMLTRKLAPALAAGCAVVAKPAEQTPLSAIALAVLAERAGLPAGLINVVTGRDGPAIGLEMCTNGTVRKVSFTGSTEVGRILMRQCSTQIKKLSLELGGNAPFIVFDDADVDAAVDGAIHAKFRNAGQTCVCANRIYVQSGVHDAFARKLVARVKDLLVGDGFADGVDIGPMIDVGGVEKVEAHIADAVTKGATVLWGGKRRHLHSAFFEPTVLTGATRDMKLAREETFGPLAPLFKFDTVEEVIGLANDTEFGLASYFFAGDLSKVWHVAEALEYGMVGINTGQISTEVAPFGGIKQSGLGREGSKYGIEDYLEIKYICFGGMIGR